MNRNFHTSIVVIVLLITNSARLLGQNDFPIGEHIEKWQNSMYYTIAVAEQMPDSLYGFKPTEEEMSFGEQLQHMAQNMTWLSTNYVMEGQKFVKEEKFTKKLSPVETRQLITESYQFSLTALKNVKIENLSTKKEFFAGPKTVSQILLLLHDHVTHHRGQLAVYLRLNGIKPTKYVGW